MASKPILSAKLLGWQSDDGGALRSSEGPLGPGPRGRRDLGKSLAQWDRSLCIQQLVFWLFFAYP